MSENKMIFWHELVLGNLNDDPRMLARRMMELDADDALDVTADFLVWDYGEDIRFFVWNTIAGHHKQYVPEDFVTTMFSNIQNYYGSYDLSGFGLEIIDVGSSPNMRSAATGARGSRPRGRWLR